MEKREKGGKELSREVDTNLFASHFHFSPFPFFLLTQKPLRQTPDVLRKTEILRDNLRRVCVS